MDCFGVGFGDGEDGCSLVFGMVDGGLFFVFGMGNCGFVFIGGDVDLFLFVVFGGSD